MQTLSTVPKLGHITTFGGHPVIAAAAHATLTYILKHKLQEQALEHEKTIRALLRHDLIKEIRGKGLMLALVFEHDEIANYLVLEGLKNKLILFWLLYEKRAVRLTPPLTISKKEIEKGCKIIHALLDRYSVN
jgi:acetylornithine/N-succinyldiaminopimelate aminotransferase